MNKHLLALSVAAALGASIPGAYADYDHGDRRDYRYDHRDHRDFERDRIARERRAEYLRHEHRVYSPRTYVVAPPVYVAPRVVYAAPPVVYTPPAPASLNINIPLSLP